MDPLEWKISPKPVAYPEAVREMEERVLAIREGRASELVWLLEHPPLYTAGTSANPRDLLDPGRFPVYASGRGGQYTYHGPGQRVAYVLLDLSRRGKDVRRFVHDLEEWLILALGHFNLRGERRAGRVGIWVSQNGQEAKIAALGVRIRHWVSFHGVAVNLDPNLEHFQGIVPCGIAGHGVTSLWALGRTPTLSELDQALIAAFKAVFGE
jgi:lipoyl(octanoyl) transferase